jgi:hypothetical protein
MNPLKIAGQIAVAGAVMAVIGHFGSAHSPAYEYFGPQEAMLKVSVSHASERKEACHKRTPEELAKLPPNMRSAQQCSRERVPVLLEVDLDGKMVISKLQAPNGLSKDGASTFYQALRVPAGTHKLELRMRDSARSEGFDYVEEHTIEVKPQDLVVVHFLREEQRFKIE